ncbi:MAG: hypothetical protein IKT12_05670 [Thermoguttaceae bacterium]|nr:hypothetical protein [Thermoguttaceae bacterium]
MFSADLLDRLAVTTQRGIERVNLAFLAADRTDGFVGFAGEEPDRGRRGGNPCAGQRDPIPGNQVERGLNDEIDYTIPPALLAKIHAWREFRRPDGKAATKENNPPDPLAVRYTPEAEAAAAAFVRELDDADISEKELREIYSRAAENMHKLSLIHACAKYGPDEERLVIDAECVGIAIDVSRFLLAQFRDWLRKYVAENDYEASVKKVGAWFAARPRDCVTLSEFTKRWSRFKRIEREDILETLENSGVIERETKGGTTKIWICGDEEDIGQEEKTEETAAAAIGQ